MVQTALELLYNWWIIEQKKLLIGKDSENINASNKIRLLVSQLNLSNTIPDSFDHLKEFVSKNNDIVDAPDAVVQIRNAIVHSQQEKRKKLTSIHHMAIFEALQISVWYVEMTLLCILGYEERYFNRCSGSPYAYQAQEIVPWKKE